MPRLTLKQLMDRVMEFLPDAMFDEGPDGEVLIMSGLAAHPEEDWNEGALPLRPVLDD